MKLNTEWLAEFVPLTRPLDGLCELLTMSGLEVEAYEAIEYRLENVVAVRLVDVSRHPLSERLILCRADAGLLGIYNIVCGAPNARNGLVTCLALPGARLADGTVVAAAAIRGEESNGMLCSARELGLGDDDAGILELPEATRIGASLASIVSTKDAIIDLNLTPNRGDCLSLLGVAREISALESCLTQDFNPPQIAPETATALGVELEATQVCPRYVGRVIEGVNCQATPPLWMRERLRRCGIRSINPVVDITNYVMLAVGQPMLAFDLDTLQGGIRVRAGRPSEKLQLLDGTTVDLDEDSVVIADHAVPVALAGIMGGAATGVQKATTRIFFESAYFDPIRIARTARKKKLHTDAAHRFERGVDPSGQERAVEFATKLLIEICGGTPGPTLVTEYPALTPTSPAIEFRLARANSLLGMEFSDSEARNIFERLRMSVVEQDQVWLITPPPYRFDLKKEVDLIEELVRLGGYTSIPVSYPSPQLCIAQVPRASLTSARLREQLVAVGYFEAVTYSFVARENWQMFAGELKELALANPISKDMAVMRSSLWPGLLNALIHNQNRQVSSVRLFELGMVFHHTDERLVQAGRIAGIAVGNALPEQWGIVPRLIDFYDVKQDVMNLAWACGLRGVAVEPNPVNGLHPGESAVVTHRGKRLGSIGTLHPKILKSLNILGNPIVFELDIDGLLEAENAVFKPFSKYPSVRRDIAVIVPEVVAAGAVLELVVQAGGALLKDLQLFDVYRGQGIDSDKKSLAMGLIFQAPSSTLTDSQVQAAVSEIVDLLGRELGGSLRV